MNSRHHPTSRISLVIPDLTVNVATDEDPGQPTYQYITRSHPFYRLPLSIQSDEDGYVVELQYVKTNNTDSTSTHVDASRPHSRESRRRTDSDAATAASASTREGKRKESTNSQKGERVELEQNGDTNPAPFAFGAHQMARMLDPESFDTVTSTEMGEVNGLLKRPLTDRRSPK
jgi:hypothetical protein